MEIGTMEMNNDLFDKDYDDYAKQEVAKINKQIESENSDIQLNNPFGY